MLETAMVLLIFLTLLGAVFDLGVALYQYSILRHTTNMAARDITVALASAHFEPGSTDCVKFDDVVTTYLGGKAQKLMNSGGPNVAQVVWDQCMRTNTRPLRSYKLLGTMPANCFFLCRFFPNQWKLHAYATVTMDDVNVPDCHASTTC